MARLGYLHKAPRRLAHGDFIAFFIVSGMPFLADYLGLISTPAFFAPIEEEVVDFLHNPA
jgi:hypothetical protein